MGDSCDFLAPVPAGEDEESASQVEWQRVARYRILQRDGWGRVPAKIIAKWLPYEDAIALRNRLAAAPGVAQRRFGIDLHTPSAVRGALARPGDLVVHRIRGPEQTSETGCTVASIG